MGDTEWGQERPPEGVPGLPGPAAEIDITDAALAGEVAGYGATAAAPVWPEPDEPSDAAPPDVAEDLPPDDVDSVRDRYPADAPAPPALTVADVAPDAADAAYDGPPPPPLRKVLESILLVVDEPVPEVNLAQVLEEPRTVVRAALEALAEEYARDDRGFELREVAGGWRLYTAPDCAAYVERFVLDGQQARLTQAALETLAVIAYRQPVSRQAVSAIRGVNVDGVVRTLLSRGLVAEAGEEGPGGAHLYVTTPYFLERLGLRSLDDLPNLAPLLPVNIDDLTDNA